MASARYPDRRAAQARAEERIVVFKTDRAPTATSGQKNLFSCTCSLEPLAPGRAAEPATVLEQVVLPNVEPGLPERVHDQPAL
jgi:hypothetical protein